MLGIQFRVPCGFVDDRFAIDYQGLADSIGHDGLLPKNKKGLRFEVSHPGDKNKSVARVGTRICG
jgi:hypothetical protein